MHLRRNSLDFFCFSSCCMQCGAAPLVDCHTLLWRLNFASYARAPFRDFPLSRPVDWRISELSPRPVPIFANRWSRRVASQPPLALVSPCFVSSFNLVVTRLLSLSARPSRLGYAFNSAAAYAACHTLIVASSCRSRKRSSLRERAQPARLLICCSRTASPCPCSSRVTFYRLPFCL